MSKIFDTVKTISDNIREEATFFLFWLKETFNQVKFINWYTLNGKLIFSRESDTTITNVR